jgi:hypothetical protein
VSAAAVALTIGVGLLVLALVAAIAVRSGTQPARPGRHVRPRARDAADFAAAFGGDGPGDDEQWPGWLGGLLRVRRLADDEAAADRRAAEGGAR